MPQSAIAGPSPPIESDSWPATTRPSAEPITEVTRSSAFDVPRVSVGNSSASSVPIARVAGAAATIAIGHEDPEDGTVAEEEDDGADRPDEQAQRRDRAAAARSR